ncbi:flagellar FliL protein [Caloramator quimbayensis]|uniref:Flagellar protein FliL n=1 Tax=Caloramator quimbayensis TaxID=1147123 RepID=A0A1T4XA38_9CLOT|nr:flagellar basal body-associated FliL family protein [Caloramator quimbayensis]SKA86433.1 flagellar FliL protein [Caloramator quimbayensis]
MSSGKSKIIIIILVILLLIAVGIGTFFGYNYFFKSKKTEPKKVPENTVALENIIVNLSDEDAKVYIKTQINLGYTKKNGDKEINSYLPQIRDRINIYLRGKKSGDFNKDGLNKIRQELLKQVNEVIGENIVTNLYFYEIIIQ